MINSNYNTVEGVVRSGKTVFIDPGTSRVLLWVKSKSYLSNTLVVNNGYLFVSKQPVPANIDIANDEYWAAVTWPYITLKNSIDQLSLKFDNYNTQYASDKLTAEKQVAVINNSIKSLQDNKLDAPKTDFPGTQLLAVSCDREGNNSQTLLTLVVEGNPVTPKFNVVGRNLRGVGRIVTLADDDDDAHAYDILNREYANFNLVKQHQANANYIKNIRLTVDDDYKLKINAYNGYGNLILQSNVVDLPIESLVTNVSYNDTNNDLVITLQNGNKLSVPLDNIISGLATTSQLQNKLDLIEPPTRETDFVMVVKDYDGFRQIQRMGTYTPKTSYTDFMPVLRGMQGQIKGQTPPLANQTDLDLINRGELTEKLGGKLDKATNVTGFQIYGTKYGSNETLMWRLDDGLAAYNRIPLYYGADNTGVSGGGGVLITSTPKLPPHATNKEYVDGLFGSVDTALDGIIAIQNSLLGGGNA